jgi:hypothetical protein
VSVEGVCQLRPIGVPGGGGGVPGTFIASISSRSRRMRLISSTYTMDTMDTMMHHAIHHDAPIDHEKNRRRNE